MVDTVSSPVLKISEFNNNKTIIFIYHYTNFVYLNIFPTGNGFTDDDAKFFADALSVSD